MTEQEWLESADPEQMLRCVASADDGRRSLRVAVSACRRRWPLLVDQRSRQAVETLVQYAQGQASDVALVGANQQAEEAFHARKHKEIAKHVGDDLAARAMAEPKSLFALMESERARSILNRVDDNPFLLAASAVWSATAPLEELTVAGYARTDATICALAQAVAASEDMTAESAAQAADIREEYRGVFQPDA